MCDGLCAGLLPLHEQPLRHTAADAAVPLFIAEECARMQIYYRIIIFGLSKLKLNTTHSLPCQSAAAVCKLHTYTHTRSSSHFRYAIALTWSSNNSNSVSIESESRTQWMLYLLNRRRYLFFIVRNRCVHVLSVFAVSCLVKIYVLSVELFSAPFSLKRYF